MKNLLFALLVVYVASLVEPKTVAAQAGAGTQPENPYQLVEEDRRTGGNHQPLARQTGQRWVVLTNSAESTPVPARAGTSEEAEGTERISAKVPGETPVNGGWLCNCDECQCVDDSICKAGDCKRNYILLFTAKWCRYCPAQKAVIEQLREEGYIVYIVDYDNAKQAANELRVTSLPTTLVFNEGQEVARYVGRTRAEQVKAGVKKRDEQNMPEPQPEPQPDPYDLMP